MTKKAPLLLHSKSGAGASSAQRLPVSGGAGREDYAEYETTINSGSR